MIDGPLSAPSSPPEMPAPTKLMPVSRTAFSRRMVSVNSALPPSTMMSPGSKTSTSSSMTASVPLPACTMMIAVRGFASESANSSYAFGGDEAGLGVLGGERVGLLRAAVEDGDRVALAAREVAGEVRAHHRQPDDSDVGLGCIFGHRELLVFRSGDRIQATSLETMSPLPPVVVMGVSGSGKSTVGAALARALSVPFVDARRAASGGEPAQDGGRHPARRRRPAPWLDAGRRAARRRADRRRLLGAQARLPGPAAGGGARARARVPRRHAPISSRRGSPPACTSTCP